MKLLLGVHDDLRDSDCHVGFEKMARRGETLPPVVPTLDRY